MRIEVKQDISEIPEANWDEIVTPADLFHSHHYLAALDKAKVEGAHMEFVLFFEGEKLVGTSVLSDFEINLDLFIGEGGVVQGIKKVFPRFFKIRVLFCGTPMSAGHHNFHLTDPALAPQAVALLTEYMADYCTRNKVQYSVFKEFKEVDTQLMDGPLESQGYFRGYSLPSAEMELPFANYAEYLASLRAKYRRQILAAQRKIGQTQPVFVSNYFEGPQTESQPVLTVLKPSQYDPKVFYELYCQVMERATVKLEVLNEAFFEHFFAAMEQEIFLLTMVFQGKVLGVFVVAWVGETVTFIWTGKTDFRDEYDTYFNLMSGMVAFALEKGCTNLVLGQTSFYAKQRIGGLVEDLFLYFKCHKGGKHWVLEKLNAQLFPRLEVPELRVFKK